MIGLALGQLVVGPLSDSLGRKRPLVAGIALHIVSSLLALFATGIAMLGALRVFQGMGAAAAAVVTMAMVRDLFSDKAVAVVMSRLMLILGVAPVIAPGVGGALLVALTPVSSVVMASLFAYVSGASFVYQDQFGLDQQQFALVFSAGAFSMIGATQVNVRLLRRWSPLQIVRASLTAALAFGLVAIVVAHFEFGGLAGLVAALWIMLAAICFVLPNAPALALSRHGEAAGSAAALLGSMQYAVGALVAPAVGLLGNTSVALVLSMTACVALALAVMIGTARRQP
ncbi:DHA1 family bicyclomycin/chloramphenicol resistance-like MFS transporter [Rhodococcus sp. AG1013]|nr:DHA1 family bicyclomycin/chloramphenicol resistance-like MFS transporter [Rhodococcus sp. AG1013]